MTLIAEVAEQDEQQEREQQEQEAGQQQPSAKRPGNRTCGLGSQQQGAES